MSSLTFNILTFKHPEEEYTFYFTNDETEGLFGIYNTLVPDEVIEHFGEQERYYTSFDNPVEGLFSVTKKSRPVYIEMINDDEETITVKEKNIDFHVSLLKRFYNYKIHKFFSEKDIIVKPNFIHDTEIWLPSDKLADNLYKYYDRYTLKVQIARLTKQPEILITYEGKPKVFKQSIDDFNGDIPPEDFNWVLYKGQLLIHDNLSDQARRELEKVYPVWNFDIRNALRQPTEAPERGNKYIKFKSKILYFYNNYLCKEDFKSIIPLNCSGLTKVDKYKIGKVKSNSNQLIFGNNNLDKSPVNGMKNFGPYKLGHSKVHFFYILHKSSKKQFEKIDSYFKGKERGFRGLYNYTKLQYHTEKNFSIGFEDKENPIPEIERKIQERTFKPDVHYIAIYISPISKDTSNPEEKSIYYKVKELLLKYKINSQVLDAEKILDRDVKYWYSLPNIAIATLAKLNGTPWRLDTELKNELIIGIGAFKNRETDIQYIGSAFSFMNNGKFNRFEVFRNKQIDELSGSILRAVKEYAGHFKDIQRLVIHFYKNMSYEELKPIERGLKELGLDNIPVFIVKINKTESKDIIAFDNNWEQLMPLSGTYINIGRNSYLLFNNVRYNNYELNEINGLPFPVKLGITCTHKEKEKDPVIIRELINQVYQFSRMYWKSLRQQNLPVTIKYPEMVAEMFPHFQGNEIPDFGKDKLWFL